jgi:AcrR family transcriptional regulator
MSTTPPATPSAAQDSGNSVQPSPARRTSRQRDAGAASRAETQRLLLVAAGELFAERGYTGATVTAIASRAGVSLQTLYHAWGSKRQLLRAFMEQGLSGSPTAITDATWADLAQARILGNLPDNPDAQTFIRGMAHFFRTTAERASLGWLLYRDAAAVDPEIRADQRELSRLRRLTTAGLLSALPDTALRSGMTRETAIDTAMVIMGPESYDLLIRQLGYSLDRFEQWIADTLIACLLPPEKNRAAPNAADTARNG